MTDLAVVDTNVPLVANGAMAEATTECVQACIGELREFIDDRKRLVIDDGWFILREYKHKLSSSGQRNWGDAFLKWVLNNQGNAARCERVTITPSDGKGPEAKDFHEFPHTPALKSFDPSDRKFVAVANVHAQKPPISQALDSKWLGWRDALKAVGITVNFLCPGDAARIYKKKFPKQTTRRRRRSNE